jgi:hypothetical protein
MAESAASAVGRPAEHVVAMAACGPSAPAIQTKTAVGASEILRALRGTADGAHSSCVRVLYVLLLLLRQPSGWAEHVVRRYA